MRTRDGRTLDWTLPGVAGFSCGRYPGDGSLDGDGTFEWTSEDGDGWDAEEWIFRDGSARVAPLREAASHGDPRSEFARSDHTEICFEAASVPPVALVDP